MPQWKVQLLGPPAAHNPEGKAARLRSKETWAVLASLLLDQSLKPCRTDFTPPRLSRLTLANRFWGDKLEARTHLRQAIASLKSAFGAKAFCVERDTIQAVPGYFLTDIEEMLRLYEEAKTATTAEERLDGLIRAEGKIGGDFLEECFDPLDEGANWHTGIRAQIESKTTVVLLALVEAQRTEGNLTGAFDTAFHLLTLSPDNREGKQLVWELGMKTGQENVLHALEATQDYNTALPRIVEMERKERSLTSRDTRIFEILLEEHLKTIPPSFQPHLASLALFPAAFSAILAKSVCRVPRSVLTALVEANLLEKQEALYAVIRPVRSPLWRRVTPSEKRSLRNRLKTVCMDWVKDYARGTRYRLPIFRSATEAHPYLEMALAQMLEEAVAQDTVQFFTDLQELGITEVVKLLTPHLSYLDDVVKNEANTRLLRVTIARLIGLCALAIRKFHDATYWFDLCLALVREEDTFHRSNLLLVKAQSAHYGGDSDLAACCLREIIHHSASIELSHLAATHRFLCEVMHHLEEYGEALHHAETAHTLYLRLDAVPASRADALFWLGKSFQRLNKSSKAEAHINEALEIWLELGDKTGTGHCVRVLATLLMEREQYAQAQANLEYAVSLHQQTGSEGCRVAAVEVLAEIALRRGRYDQARLHFQDCLAYYEAQKSIEKVTHLRLRLGGLPIPIADPERTLAP